ncbi:MAG: low-specificity L-threonine aldolase [Planctomycetaceae bacterium]|nr:low-specificity L-threonine aldolase [Planctomycetaceae bacterium]
MNNSKSSAAPIDLRSDTVTRPSQGMRQAMANAEVGDDVMGEDPTVNRLEEMIAEMFGHESAVLACSGTQSNQMGVRVHCIPGDELLIHETGHIFNFEGGAAAALSGVSIRTLPGARGMLDLAELDGKVRVNDQHFCRTRLVCLENTTNLGGGCVYSLDQMQRVSEWAMEHQLKRHLDGARVFNAIVAGGYSAREIGQHFDTISICFSKGLGCPFGSMLTGSREDIAKARRIRKIFGGAMRQSGIVAAAALYALEHNVDRLAEDHRNAQVLADGLRTIDGITDVPTKIETNLVFFQLAPHVGTAVQFAGAMREKGILIGPMGGQRVRMVTHLDVSADDIQTILSATRDCFATGFANRPTTGKGPFSR